MWALAELLPQRHAGPPPRLGLLADSRPCPLQPRYHSDRSLAAARRYAELAKSKGLTLAQLALAWCKSRWWLRPGWWLAIFGPALCCGAEHSQSLHGVGRAGRHLTCILLCPGAGGMWRRPSLVPPPSST